MSEDVWFVEVGGTEICLTLLQYTHAFHDRVQLVVIGFMAELVLQLHELVLRLALRIAWQRQQHLLVIGAARELVGSEFGIHNGFFCAISLSFSHFKFEFSAWI